MRKFDIQVPLLDFDLIEKYDVYLVGGTIRDFFLKKPLTDYDIAVCNVELFLKDLRRKNPGITLFPLSEEDKEYRCVLGEGLWIDVSELKGRSIEEDLRLRDFTFNAMALNLRIGELIDPYNGQRDLAEKTIRMISSRNLIDDPLRILRAYRFMAILGFKIEQDTEFFIRELSPLISTRYVAAERIKFELFLILESDRAGEVFSEMAKSGVLFSIFPELTDLKTTSQRYYNDQNLLFHTLQAVKNLEKILMEKDYEEDIKVVAKLAMLLHDVGKPKTISYDEEGNTHFYGHDKLGSEMAEEIAERLKLSRKEKNILKKLVRFHMYPHLLAAQRELTERAVNRYLRRMEELAFPLLDMAIADAMASPPRGDGILPYHKFEEKIFKVIEEKAKVGKERIVTGYDLIALGLKPGPIFKEILQEIDDLLAEGKIKTKDDALKYVMRKYVSN